MLSVILNVIFPVFLAVCVGYCWGRSKFPFDSDFVTRIVTYIGAPCLILATVNDTNLEWREFLELGQWSILLLCGFAFLGWIFFRLLGLDYRALSLSVVFPNVGNMGLSLCLFAFGEAGLASGLIVFVTVFLVQMACGDLLMGTNYSRAEWLPRLLKEPIFCVSLMALLIVITGWKLPQALALGLKSLGGMTIPLMLITLGVSLSRIVNVDWRKGWLISLLRVPGGFLVSLLIVYLFSLEGITAKVLVLQGTMPSAVFNYFFALRHQSQTDTVASSVVLSTIISFLTLPFLLWFLMGFG